MHPQTMRNHPARFDPLPFTFLPSGLMSLRVSGVATRQSLGLRSDFGTLWRVSFPPVMVIAPMARRQVAHSVCPRS